MYCWSLLENKNHSIRPPQPHKLKSNTPLTGVNPRQHFNYETYDTATSWTCHYSQKLNFYVYTISEHV